MPDLAPAAVAQYTSGRLNAEDPEVIRMLSAALAAARRWCGWHVTPAQTETVTVDGPGGRTLRLPTLQLGTLTSVVEDGAELDVDDLYVSALGLVEKKLGAWWSTRFGSITFTMTHGFNDAPDFDSAVLSFIERTSFAGTGGRPRVIGPFQYETDPMAAGSVFTGVERALLEQYRLERPA